ncbi:hypothetical protein Ciccas_010259 [Cichlidogyrus casuarinus]|uniref:Ribosomal RNA-processing protein 42 n=1 Tax=Cichlidogyrus casuarinus TaxID=1844966 RepID=A0ABD2PUY3_9PLAT
MGQNLTTFFQSESGIRVQDFMDLKKLGIRSGSQCWVMFVDFLVLMDGGNVLDAASLAFKAALYDLRLPQPLHSIVSLNKVPLYVTVSKVGDSFIFDASDQEETCAFASLSLAMQKDGVCCGVIHTGCGSIAVPTYKAMIASSVKIAAELHLALESAIDKQKILKS